MGSKKIHRRHLVELSVKDVSLCPSCGTPSPRAEVPFQAEGLNLSDLAMSRRTHQRIMLTYALFRDGSFNQHPPGPR